MPTLTASVLHIIRSLGYSHEASKRNKNCKKKKKERKKKKKETKIVQVGILSLSADDMLLYTQNAKVYM